jgi:serine/threonine protein kinase
MLKEEESNFIGQGAYGCVYKQNLTCANDKNADKKPKIKEYLTKVHMKKENAKSEVEVSEKIRQIKNYERYFSPVLESCTASLAEINRSDIEKCKLVKDPEAKYFTTKVRYIVGKTMDEYIDKFTSLSKSKSSSPKRQQEKIIYMCEYLEKGAKVLNKNGIVHFDLKESNVIVDETDRPIIIDFGLSIILEKLVTQKDFADAFYYFTYDKADMKYEPWCVEIALLSYLSQQRDFEQLMSKQDADKAIEIAFNYIDGVLPVEPTDAGFIIEADVKEYKERKQSNIKKFVGKKVRELVNELMKTYDKWDKYAIGVMMMNNLKFSDTNKKQIDMIRSRILF